MSEVTPPAATPRRSSRLPLYTLLLVIAGVVFAWTFPYFERMIRVVLSGSIVALGAIVFEIWLVFFNRRFSWKTRKRIGIGLVLAHVLFFGIFRIKEFSGDMVPVLTFRWTPERDRTLEKLATTSDQSPDKQVAADFPQKISSEDFPKFLGQLGNGTVETDLDFDFDWGKAPPREVWRKPIGAGWSGFSVIGPYAVTQEQRDTDECVTCYEKLTGNVVWSVSEPVRFTEALGGVGPRATPTIIDGKVYAIGATGILSCIEGKTGKLRWKRDTLDEFKQTTLDWAKSSSPLIVENQVIVSLQAPLVRSADGTNAQTDLLAAYDREKGEPLWSVKGDKGCYATPRVAEIAGVRQIVNVNAESVTGHAIEDGSELWRYSWPGTQPKCTDPYPLPENQVLITAGYGLGGVLLQLEKRADGTWGVEEKWKSNQLKTRFMNPVIHEGLIFALDDGILSCVELSSGKKKWKSGRYGHGQLLFVKEHLVIVSETGELAVVEATGKAFKELHRMPALNGKTWNTLALTGRLLLMRNAEEAVCYELPVK